jgi:hypothetical protein
MTTITHPLTGETIDLDIETVRAELEREHGIDLSDMKPTSVVMNYNALLRQRANADD